MAVTGVQTKAIAVRRKQMVQGSAVSPPYDLRQSSEPWGRNTVLGNVVEALAFATITSFEEPRATNLRFRVAGTAPVWGEPHCVFASDGFDWV